jgi:hypothetical protein
MSTPLQQLEFSGRMLARGFWLYVWEITAQSGRKLYYVGRTGDSSSLKAQSPFARLSQHLGSNRRSNALRRKLEEHGLAAEECKKFRLFAHGPIFPQVQTKAAHTRSRDIVAGLEKALADALKDGGYPMLNEVKCRKQLDGQGWREVLAQFAPHFPALRHRAPHRELRLIPKLGNRC